LQRTPFDIFVEVADTQISAYISDSTREEVERYVEAHGLKKGSLVEEALLHHLQALRELPQDIVIPPRIRVSRRSFQRVAGLVQIHISIRRLKPEDDRSAFRSGNIELDRFF
jgi:hypothetical protein